jgi:hypothetical protein
VLALVGLLGLGLAAYWSTLDNGFQGDDFAYVFRARFISTADSVRGEFSAPPRPQPDFVRPLAVLLYTADHALYGLHPGGYHATNVLLHLTAGLLLYAILRQSLPDVAFVASGLFLTAPLTVESVAWIASRFDLLMATCYLAGVLALLAGRPYLSALGAAGAMLSKESGVTFPLAALAISFLRGRGVGPVLPACAVGAGYLALRLLLFGDIGGYRDPGGTPLWFSGAHWRRAIRAYEGFPLLLVVPLNRWVFGLFPWASLVAAMSQISWIGLFRREAWRPPLLLGLGWAVVTFLPTAPFPPLPWLDPGRFLYLPSAGLAVAQAWLVLQLPRRRLTASIVLASSIFTANLNLIPWESASDYSKRVVHGLQEQPPRDGHLGFVMPDNVGGAFLGRNVDGPLLSALFRPGVVLDELTPEQVKAPSLVYTPAELNSKALPPNPRASVVAPRIRACLPRLGPLDTCWEPE